MRKSSFIKEIFECIRSSLYAGDTEPTEYRSELHAWDVTCGHHHHIDQKSSYPTEHMKWASVGLQNPLTFLQIDCESVGINITVACGGKALGFLCECHHNPMSSINFFLKDTFCLNEVFSLLDYDFEFVAFLPGDQLQVYP